MPRIATLLLLVLLACGGGTRQVPGGAGGGSAPAGTVEAVQGVVERWRQGWQVRSVDALAALYPHDLDVVVVDGGVAHLGWTAVQTYLSTRIAEAQAIHVTIDDLQVYALGDRGAAAVATVTREVSDGVTSVAERGVVTWALRADDDGAWRIVAEHYSR
jgi:uncharacterized protein (TIGR02246 family)